MEAFGRKKPEMETSLPTFDDFLGRGHLFAGLSSQVFVFFAPIFVFVFGLVFVCQALLTGIFNFVVLANTMAHILSGNLA